MRFAIFGATYRERNAKVLAALKAALARKQASIILEQIDDDTDFAISLGGDGTFLSTAACVGAKQIPIIGINTGHLGFLVSYKAEDIDMLVNDIYEGRYKIEEHSVLEITTNADIACRYALNEIALLKHDISSMISIRTSINNEYLTTYKADGLIIGTPTGSTAYSLSVGGPIVDVHSHTISLTPIAPHSLSMRPIVLRDDTRLRFEIISRSHSFLMAIDGRSYSCNEKINIEITKAKHNVRVVCGLHDTFFSTLRRKMGF